MAATAAAVALSFMVATIAAVPSPVHAVSGGGSDYAGTDISNKIFLIRNNTPKRILRK